MILIRKILVPTDFSDESVKALRYAAEFVRSLMGVEIVLVHVMEAPVYPPLMFAGGVSVATVMEDIREACQLRLDKLIEEEVPEWAEGRPILTEGRPFAKIVEIAKAEEVDLIIVATHGYTGIKHVVLGSTAEKIVRAAPCPVLTVRDSEREFVRP